MAGALAMVLVQGLAPAANAAREPTAFGLASATETQREATERRLGRSAAIVSLYTDFTRPFPAEAVEQAHADGAAALISWEPWDWDAGGVVEQPGFSLRSIIAGAHDDFMAAWLVAAQSAASDGRVLVRFAPEMNCDWTPWSPGVNDNEAHEFVLAWRHVHSLADAIGARDIAWVWNPTVRYPGSIPFARVYPGSGTVDMVALDGFNWGTTRPWSRWQSYDEVFAASVRELRRVAPGKPWGIAETASAAKGGDKAAWITEALRRASRQGADFLVWFDMAKEADWRLASTSTTARAARAGVADPTRWLTLPLP